MITLLDRFPVKPVHYSLVFEPDLNALTFAGEAAITLRAEKPAAMIVLHAAELAIHECWLEWKGRKLPAAAALDSKNEELTLTLPQAVDGEAVLHLRFTGTLNDHLLGFYRSEYRDEHGTHLLATTQFEAADARRAFPCWDEPAAKATFDVTLIVDSGLEALSNMPLAERKTAGNKTLFRFARTPVMSTYLLYLGVGEFEFLEGSCGKLALRIVTAPGKKEQGKLALGMAKKFLQFFNGYFGIPYPLPKLDMIAIPDFAAGAMENWGAITFRETRLLFDPKTSSHSTEEDIADVIAHELAHQWFGNLVTMRWWNDLWLNESFATFMATKAADHLHPEWKLWEQFLKRAMVNSMSLDALRSSHPINVAVKRPAEVREIFDSISYDKGASVLRMLEDYISPESFRKGLSQYLAKHQHGNATTHDLWRALGEASGRPVDEMMATWVEQMGYPVLSVRSSGGKLKLRQKRFLLDGGTAEGQWSIPVSAVSAAGAGSDGGERGGDAALMTDEELTLAPTPSPWLKLNAGQKGFYRVSYDAPQLARLKELVEAGKLSAADRWGVQHDLFAFCLAGTFPVRRYIEFVRCYARDSEYLPSADVAANLSLLWLLSAGEPFWKELAAFSISYLREVFPRLGWDAAADEPSTHKLFRPFVISALGRHGDDAVLQEAQGRFARYRKDPDTLHPDIRSAVYSLAAWAGNAETHAVLTELYQKAPSAEEKVRFLGALAGFQDGQLLQETLAFALSPDVRSQDLIVPIFAVAGNPHGKRIVWPWMRAHWKEITAKYGAGNPLLNRTLDALGVITRSETADEIASFYRQNPVPGTERKIAQTLEKIRIYARLMEGMRGEF